MHAFVTIESLYYCVIFFKIMQQMRAMDTTQSLTAGGHHPFM